MLHKNPAYRHTLKNNTPDNDVEITKANEFPIENMYSGTLKKTGKTLMGCCPFHQDDKPSFAIYPETNTWCCFGGCGGGDAIAYYMKLNEVSFSTALEALAQ